MKTGFLSLALSILLSLCSPSSADDLALFQGTWEMKGSNKGKPVQVIKTIKDNHETVEVYTGGVLTQKHEVEFELKTYGPAKVFVWKKGVITEGPRKGQSLPAGRFIYKIEPKKLTGVHGMLEGDQTPILREVYMRVADTTA